MFLFIYNSIFLKLLYNCIISAFCFLPSNHHTYAILLSYRFMVSFILLLHTSTHVYVYIHKYNPFSLYKVSCVCIFSGLIICYSITNFVLFSGKDYFFHSENSLVLVVLCLGLRIYELYPFHISMFIGVVLVHILLWQPWLGDFMVVASDVSRRHNIIENSFYIGRFPNHEEWECSVDLSLRSRRHNFTSWLVEVLYNDLSLLLR